MKKYISLLLIVTLCACISPYTIKVKKGNEETLNCEQLSYELQKVEMTRQAAHDDDKFTFKKILPSNGVSTVYNLWVVDAHARDRTALLNKVAQEKGCMNSPSSSNPNEIIVAQAMPEELPDKPKEAQTSSPETRVMMQDDEGNKLGEDDPRSVDKDTSEYIKNGYDAVVYPRKDPKHFTF